MMYPWQEKIINGFKPGEMTITMSGRQAGKSQMQAYMRLWNDIHYRPVSDLELSEGTVYGSRYYCVEPIGGNWLEMETWCIDAFGERSNVWDITSEGEQLTWRERGRWYANDRKFWFSNDADRLMFVMKWR